MVIINSKSIDDSFEIRLHKAPFDFGRSHKKARWINCEIPFFEKDIYQLWSIYSTPLPGSDSFLLPCEEIDERSRYIKRPITTVVRKDRNTAVGGIWVEDILNKNETKTCKLHISVLAENRKVAYPLMEYFLQTFNENHNTKGRYIDIKCEWGKREPQDNPTGFFRNIGFIVNATKNEGVAYLPVSKTTL